MRILLIEDNEDDTELIREMLGQGKGETFDFEWVDRLSAGLERLGKGGIEVVLLDLSLPDGQGLSTFERAHAQAPDVPIIVLSGLDNEEVAVRAVKGGAQDYLVKGQVDGNLLVRALRYAIERKRAQGEVQRNLERIRALHEIDKAITSTLDLHDVLNVLLEKIDYFLPYSVTTLRLINKETGLLEAVAARNVNEEEWKATMREGGRGFSKGVLKSKAPVIIGNVQKNTEAKYPEFLRRYGLISYLGLPLVVKDNTLGTIGFYTKEEHQFTTEEIQFLSTLAGQAAIAIHNSQLYEEMKTLVGDLARSNKVKDEFLSVMSHELRTPVNVITGYTGIIKDGMLGEINLEQEKALEKVINRSNDLLGMITGILEATSIKAEAVKVKSHEVSLGDFLDDLRSFYVGPMNKELALNWDYPSDLPIVKTDSEKLRHILQNLINNGIKFTEKGSVTISTRCLDGVRAAVGSGKQAEGNGQVEFKVTDTGIGIPKEVLTFIFEKFHQVDSSETRLYGGVGMGLYIAKRFTELLGGKIDVESEPGKGSTFTVTLPYERFTPGE